MTYICIACGTSYESLTSLCEQCGNVETVIEDESEITVEPTERPRKRAKKACKVNMKTATKISTGRKAWDIVLSGGLVRPSSILVPGPRGVGKSTSLLRILNHLGQAFRKPVLYGCSEMNAERIKALGVRLNLEMHYLFINDSRHWEDMHDDIVELKPVAIVWDSIHRYMVDDELGEISLRKVVTGAIEMGERYNAISFLVSHVTKGEDFVGDSSIGHDVDVVLWMRRAGPGMVTIECSDKNRDGPTPLTATERLE
jgi:DNA repair protein RadA/Sms